MNIPESSVCEECDILNEYGGPGRHLCEKHYSERFPPTVPTWQSEGYLSLNERNKRHAYKAGYEAGKRESEMALLRAHAQISDLSMTLVCRDQRIKELLDEHNPA
jgi:hypothetical protein